VSRDNSKKTTGSGYPNEWRCGDREALESMDMNTQSARTVA
jgi:hypothetical protein